MNFRAWDSEKNEMVTDFETVLNIMIAERKHRTDRYIIEQSIDILDMEGVEVFEGDIVEIIVGDYDDDTRDIIWRPLPPQTTTIKFDPINGIPWLMEIDEGDAISVTVKTNIHEKY